MAATPTIRPAGPGDAERLHAALVALSADLGDTHRAGPADLLAAGFGPLPAFLALIAEGPQPGPLPLGAVVFSPVFSTVRGAPGLYVSDLWVAAQARGAGLGARLLAAARDRARAAWGARFLRLVVYADNPQARRFYDRLGFSGDGGLELLTLDEAALAALGDAG